MTTAGVCAAMRRAGWHTVRPDRPRTFESALCGATPAEALTQHDRHLMVALLVDARRTIAEIAELGRMTETVVLRIVGALGHEAKGAIA